MALASIGVCYYPEHWPRDTWAEQAQTMRSGGIELVRIAEFAWSRIEPSPGHFDWEWLDCAIDTLAAQSLQIIMCTPTACPPLWLIERYPEILPVDSNDNVRRFGSRRHYRFASSVYRCESTRISQAVIDRYATHPAIVGWQLDNEYGCHETTLSYAEDDERAFQRWLETRHADIDALNEAWGTVFWSQEYRSFAEVGRPNLTVTEANPAHRLDYWRFASEQVRDFNAEQRQLLRDSEGSDRWVTHNFMGNFVEFDHFDVGEDLDVATWDSYPLGFLDQGWFTDDEKLRYRRIGHPDWAAFHHDLYRAVCRGRFAVMEQQPGPVNWAQSNAQPLDSAPAFWGMEAVAHGAEFVSYFRYQQLPRAQEQMHAALRLPTGEEAPAWSSVSQLAQELGRLPAFGSHQAPIALLFDYPSCWAGTIQPHAPGMDQLESTFHYYCAARALGLDIDIVNTKSNLQGYKMLIIPGTVIVDAAFIARAKTAGVSCLVGARSGSRDEHCALPQELAPGPIQSVIPVRVLAVDSMRPGATRSFNYAGRSFESTRWHESVESDSEPQIRCDDGAGLWYSAGSNHYINAHVPEAFLTMVMQEILAEETIQYEALPEGFRIRRRGPLIFAFNFSPETRHFEAKDAHRILGSSQISQGQYAIWQHAND
ncbi:beta-galactosidase [Congregibacter variabilis]|uniref:Beta-galactosidase n=1 Tax=Congregibacter variabilis TaxID=3081200 RepID=A0ABZ0I5P2_9GAMM|nr:beta-galactosidase [Congregibacter sp. IMCC43200]